MWRKVRVEAKLPGLRIKDLRHVAAVAASNAGVSQAQLMAHLGHSNRAQTRAYLQTNASLSAEQAEAVAAEFGL